MNGGALPLQDIRNIPGVGTGDRITLICRDNPVIYDCKDCISGANPL
jgi:hypothetical protein